MYLIPIVGVGAVLYYLMTKEQAIVSPVAPVTPISQAVGVPSYTGIPSTDATSQLLALAEQQCGLSGDSVVVRSLRPQDLGLTSFSHTSTGANVWDNFASTTVADCTFIAIIGISYAGSNFSQMRVNAGASYVGYAPLAFVSGLVSQVHFFAQPLTAEQNQPIIIDIIAKAVATENVNLMGTVVEKRGMLISP